jgi:hypothetical protein
MAAIQIPRRMGQAWSRKKGSSLLKRAVFPQSTETTMNARSKVIRRGVAISCCVLGACIGAAMSAALADGFAGSWTD